MGLWSIGKKRSGWLFSLVWAGASAAEPLDHWQQRYPPLPIINLTAIAFGDGKFVAVGEKGTIIRFSSDTGWTVQYSGITNDLMGVTFGNGQFIVVAARGQVLASADAVNWTAHKVDSLFLRAVTFGNGLFVAVSDWRETNKFLTSSDGVTWTSRPYYTTSDFVWPKCLTYGAGMFVAGGSPSFYSTNGLEWYEVTNGLVSFSQSLSHGNGLFVGHDRYSGAVSMNGKDWEGMDSGSGYDKFAAAQSGQHHVWVGENGRFGHSRDGTNWSMGIVPRSSSLYGVAYGQQRFVAVGAYGSMVYSVDATNWSRIFPGPPDAISDLDYVSGRYIATDIFYNGAVHVSSNLVEWQTGHPPSPLTEVTYFNGRFVGVGNNGAIAVSTNALDWTPVASPVTTPLFAIANSSNTLVAVGDYGDVLSSFDGTNWVARDSGATTRLFSIVRGDGYFVAVGELGSVIRSADGQTWQQATVASRPALQSVAFGKCRFVAANGPYIFLSTNGLDWANVYSGSSLTLYSVAYGNGTFLACGYNSYPFPNSCVLSSSNGVNWRCHALPSYRGYSQAAFGGGRFILHVDGLILQSDSVPAPSLNFRLSVRRAGSLEITASGLPDTCCRVEATPRLGAAPWQPVDYLILNTSGVARYSDASVTNDPARFFRSVAIP